MRKSFFVLYPDKSNHEFYFEQEFLEFSCWTSMNESYIIQLFKMSVFQLI